MDSLIRSTRNKFRRSKDDAEAMEILVEIDRLQRLRHKETGSFLPHSDGKVYIFDLNYQQWMIHFTGLDK